jgi:hypothetical protein
MFVQEFHNQCGITDPKIREIWGSSLQPDRQLFLDRVEVWKSIGDEILFTDVLCSEAQVAAQVMAFYDALHIIDESVNEHGLGVKGTIWTAGFPIRNKEVRFSMGEPSYTSVKGDHTDPETGDNIVIAGTWFNDFVGPEIDSGFRLTKHTSRRRILVSLDVADFLTRNNRPHPIRVHHVGWRNLKGCYGDRPYPIFWISRDDLSRNKDLELWEEPWEGWPDDLAQQFFKGKPKNRDDLQRFIDRYRSRMQDVGMIKPYIRSEAATDCHKYRYQKGIEPVREIKCGWGQGGYKMMPIDALHRMKTAFLKSDEERQSAYDHACLIVNHEKYQGEWIENEEFVTPFAIPDEIGTENQNIKWTLDRLGLIKGNELQVKITTVKEKILFTDGLWVPGLYRVFPFTDENEQILRYIHSEEGLSEWPDVLIDPATGCGHHVCAMSHIPRKIAADVNARAVAYCDMNRILNRVENTFVLIHDIRDGMPVIEPRNLSGNVLFMINMPFALEPAKDILPLSARGGETGARMTFEALRALKKFTEENEGNAKIRALVLNYSVGNDNEDRWEIKSKAEELFGEKSVCYKILRDQKMWRVNGKKEQGVPMPVESIKMKAECKYYVNDLKRSEAEEGYINLEKKLLRAGWDVVGYGILDIGINLD